MAQAISPMTNLVESVQPTSLSPSQKKFQKLIKEIELKRQLLASWEAFIPQHQHKYATQFEPLLKQFHELRSQVVKMFDNAYADKALTKIEQGKIQDAICMICAEILASQDNPDIKEIYNRYSESDYDAEILEKKEDMAWMMKDIFGIDCDDEMGDSPEEWMVRMQDKMQEQQAQQEEPKTTRKKSAKTLAKEAKEKEAETHVSQSLRDVYRQLARALHPDKEQDASERDRKTILMQRVNAAYTQKDLLSLLELQLEVEQIDQTMMGTLSEERLKHYNKILNTQSSELQAEISDIEVSFKRTLGITHDRQLSPMGVTRFLQEDIQNMKEAIAGIKEDLGAFKHIKNIKLWLKQYETY